MLRVHFLFRLCRDVHDSVSSHYLALAYVSVSNYTMSTCVSAKKFKK